MRRQERGPLPRGFGIIWSTVAIDLIGFGIVFPLLPLYAEDFGASPTTIGALVASYSVAQLVFAPVWGRVSDRVGRKPALIVSLVGTAVGSLVTGLAGSITVLFVGRIIDGISGASVSVAQAAVADVAPEKDRPRLLGLLSAAFGLGFVIGPALGSLAALSGPALPFFVAAALAGVNAVVAVRRLPETRPAAPPGPRPRRRRVDGDVRADLARLVTVMFVAMVAFSGFEATFALLGERRVGLDLASVGATFAAIGLALVVVQTQVVGPANDRLGETGTLRAGLTANTVGLALLAIDGGWPGLVAALVLLVLGQGLLTPTLASAVSGRAPNVRRGEALGVQQSAGHLARIVGPLAAGAMFQHVGTSAPYVAGAMITALALPLVPQPGPEPTGTPREGIGEVAS